MKKFLQFIFSKEFWLNKWTIGVLSIVVIFSMMTFTYLKNPRFFPQFVKSANKNLIDRVLGKDLAEKIDTTRDENGATSIRLVFNNNKEENLERHCEKKEEQGKIQEKCYKTYQNDELGFSVEYPIDYSVEPDNTEASPGILLYPPGSKDYTDDRTCLISIGVWDKETFQSIDYVLGFYRYKENLIGDDELILGSIKGYEQNVEVNGEIWKKDYHQSNTSKGNIFRQTAAAIEKNGRIYAVSLFSIEQQDQGSLHEEDFDSILKSLKFE